MLSVSEAIYCRVAVLLVDNELEGIEKKR